MSPRKSTKSKAKPMARKDAPKKTGRPPVQVDAALLERLANLHCSNEDIAFGLGISADTLTRRFADTIEKAKANGRIGLRRAQWQAALGGDKTMLIWLGKQHLDQKDLSRFQHEGPDGKPLPPTEVTVTFVNAPGEPPTP